MKKNLIYFIISITVILSLPINVFADKICDYEFETGKSNLYVSNRTAEKCIALTFDDGPHPKYTKQILDILDKYNAKATFFVVGKNAQLYPDIVKEEYIRGHEIGNHTYSHPNLKNISAMEFFEEISKTKEILKEITGVSPVLFRPPGGYLNNAIVEEVRSIENTSVLWSWRQDTRDWACTASDVIVKNVLDNLKDGDIILFHDYNSHKSPTPEALEKILEHLSEKGYSFVTVSELMNM